MEEVQVGPAQPVDPCPCCRYTVVVYPHPSGRKTWVCSNCAHERFSGVTWSARDRHVVGFYWPQVDRSISLWGLVGYGHEIPKGLNWGYHQAITENMLGMGKQFICSITGVPIAPIEYENRD